MRSRGLGRPVGLLALTVAFALCFSGFSNAQDVSISDFALAKANSQIVLNKHAVTEGQSLVITPDDFGRGGSAFLAQQIDISKDFTMEFGYFASSSTGCGEAADGLAFVAQPYEPTYIGSEGLYMGMNPQSRLFGVWVDAYGNGEQGDIPGSQGRWHIGLARSQQVYWRMKDSINSAEVCGRGTPANITVVYEKSNLRVFLNGNLVPELSTTLSISSLIQQNKAYIGFTGSTGGKKVKQEIRYLKLTYASTDVCPTLTNCSACTSALCSWCGDSCKLGTSAGCSRSCPRPRPPVQPPQPPVSLDNESDNPCLTASTSTCGTCISPLCVWGISAAKPQGVCIPRAKTTGFSVFTETSQCSRVCSAFQSCSECNSLGGVRGCGWCGKPSSGSARCLHSSESSSCSAALESVCSAISKCSLFGAEPTVSSSDLISNATFSFMFTGNDSVPLRYTLVARYRSPAGSLVQSIVVNSSQYEIPAQSGKPAGTMLTLLIPFTIPASAAGVPELTIDANISTANTAELKCAAASRPIIRPTEPQLTLVVNPKSIFTRTKVDIKMRVSKKGGAQEYYFEACEWFFGTTSLGKTGADVDSFVSSFGEDRIVSPGQYQFIAHCNFTFSGFTSSRILRRTIDATEIKKITEDTFFLPTPKIAEKPAAEAATKKCRDPTDECFLREESTALEVSSDLRFNIGTDKEINLFVVKTGYKFDLEIILGFKFTPVADKGVPRVAGLANTQYYGEATLEIEVKEVFLIKGVLGASFEWEVKEGKFEPAKRVITGSVEFRRVWELKKLTDKLPDVIKDKVKMEVQFGGGIKFGLTFKPQASNPDCTGWRVGSWVQCAPFELTPFLVAEGIARIGGRWAGVEAAISIEMNAFMRFGPFRFAALTVPFKFEAKVWFIGFRKSFSYQKTVCVVGQACGKREVGNDEINVLAGTEIPPKRANPGSFVDTLVTSANEYIVIDDYIDPVTFTSVALDRMSKNFALAVWDSREVSDFRPTNSRLSFSYILSNDETPDGVSFSEPEVISEIFDSGVSDSNPTVAWMPGTDAEFVLVWTRIQNASFVNTAPISQNGSIMLSDAESAELIRSTSVMWATFKPGYGWTERGSISNNTEFLTSGVVASRTDLHHPVYQPIIVAYESSTVDVNSTTSEIQLRDTDIFVSKFESSSLEMSPPVSVVTLERSPVRMSVASWGQHHNLVYEVSEFNGTVEVPRIYYKTFGWNLTSEGTFVTPNMASAPNSGIAAPFCNGSVGSIVHFAWAHNMSATESLAASDVRFVLAWTCDSQIWAGIVDPSTTAPAQFSVVVPNAGEAPILTWAHNDTHITITRWARELRASSSAYYMQHIPLSSFPPTTSMFAAAPSIRHARTTVQEDDIWTGYFQNDLLLVTSRDSLFNQKYSEPKNATAAAQTITVVKRRFVAAVFGSNQKSEELLNVVCHNATFFLPDEENLMPFVSFTCESNIAGAVTFSVLTGEAGMEENLEIGSEKIDLVPGNNAIRIPFYADLLSGGFLVIDSDAPGFEVVRIEGPTIDTQLRVVVGSVEQLSVDPAVIQLDVRNYGLSAPSAVVIAVYVESAVGNRMLVGRYEDADEETMPQLGDQLTYEVPLWGIDSPGVFQVSVALYDSIEASFPHDFFQYMVEFRRTSAITLLPHDLVPSATAVAVSIPAGEFFPTVITLIDISLEQIVDETVLQEFDAATQITLEKGSRPGPFVVCSSLLSLEETAEQLLENGLCIPVPFRELPKLTTSFAFLGLSAPDVRQFSAGSQLFYVVQPPRLSAPWGVMIRAAGVTSIPSLAVASTFLNASNPDAGGLPVYKQTPLSASAAFSSFGELSSVDSSRLYVSVFSEVADTVKTELTLVQFIDIEDDEPLLVDASAPVLLTLKPGKQGSVFLEASRDLSGAKMFLSTNGYAFTEGEGVTLVTGALSVFTETVEIPYSFENGTTIFEQDQESFVETKWTFNDLGADKQYFITLISGDAASAPFWITVNSSQVAPKRLSSCPVKVSDTESVPAIKATSRAGKIEVEISIRDEVTSAKQPSRLEDISVTFGTLPQCSWRLKDPLMLASWTQFKSSEGLTCGRRVFINVFDASEVGSCFASAKRSLTSGSVTTTRTYRVENSAQPVLVITVADLTLDQTPAPALAPTISAPTAEIIQTPVGSDSFTDRGGFIGGIVFLVIVVVVLIAVVVILILRQRKSQPAESKEAPMEHVKPSPQPQTQPRAQPAQTESAPPKKKAKKPEPKPEPESEASESSESSDSESSSTESSSSEDEEQKPAPRKNKKKKAPKESSESDS